MQHAAPIGNAARILPESNGAVVQLARTMKALKFPVQLEGHANPFGGFNGCRFSRTTNQSIIDFLQTLSEKRADAVRDALIAEGVDTGLLYPIGVGGSRPVTPEDGTFEHNADKNKRVEAHMMPLSM